MSIQKRVFAIVDESGKWGILNHIFDYTIITIIILNLAVIFIETYPDIYAEYQGLFDSFEVFTVIVFSIEYIMRIWTCTLYQKFQHPVWGRLRYACTFSMLIDVLAIFPFYYALFLPLDIKIVNLFRMLRLLRIFKLLRYYGSTDVVIEVIRKNREYLIASITILGFFLIFVSYIMLIVESDAQPDKFGEIDNAFWWAVVTLTTVGYGDVFPVTDIGKVLTIFVLIIGIGIIALPTGIIASGFLEEMRSRKGKGSSSEYFSLADEIAKLHDLRKEGALTDDEFDTLKEKLIR